MSKKFVGIDKDFNICLKIEKFLYFIYYMSIIISLVLCFDFSKELCLVLIVAHVLYVLLNATNDLIFKNYAESESRKTILSNSHKTNLTSKKSNVYHDCESTNCIKRLGVNVYESALFSRNNSRLMIITSTIEIFIDMVIWLIIVLISKDQNIVLCVTQSIFSSEILINYLKLLYFNNKVNILCDNLYNIFVTNKYNNKKEAELLEYILDYECLKNFSHILLSTINFKRNEEEWIAEWNTILAKIK